MPGFKSFPLLWAFDNVTDIHFWFSYPQGIAFVKPICKTTGSEFDISFEHSLPNRWLCPCICPAKLEECLEGYYSSSWRFRLLEDLELLFWSWSLFVSTDPVWYTISGSNIRHTCQPSRFVREFPAQTTKFRKSPACLSALAREYRISRIRIF